MKPTSSSAWNLDQQLLCVLYGPCGCIVPSLPAILPLGELGSAFGAETALQKRNPSLYLIYLKSQWKFPNPSKSQYIYFSISSLSSDPIQWKGITTTQTPFTGSQVSPAVCLECAWSGPPLSRACELAGDSGDQVVTHQGWLKQQKYYAKMINNHLAESTKTRNIINVYGNDCDLIIFNQHKFGSTLEEWPISINKSADLHTAKYEYFVWVTTSWIYMSSMDTHGNSTKTGWHGKTCDSRNKKLDLH